MSFNYRDNPLEYIIFFCFIQKIKIEIDRKTIKPIKH